MSLNDYLHTDKLFSLSIVSVEEEIFNGQVQKVYATGTVGELEVLVNHAPLLTSLAPGPVWITTADSQEEGVVILGGFLEVQPKAVIILADAAIKARDINEFIVQQRSDDLTNQLQTNKHINYAKVQSELSSAIAQLRLIKKIGKRSR